MTRNPLLRPLQLTALSILDHSDEYEWRLQGFGMLKTYIRGLGRLHIWDSTLRFPGVSLIHNHSWDLTSTVAAGLLVNQTYIESFTSVYSKPFETKQIIAGENPQDATPLRRVRLIDEVPQTYLPGDQYSQPGNVIHKTEARDGTVTIVDRLHDGPDGLADIYWPAGTQWGTAAGREARLDEVNRAVGKALILLEKELRG